MATTQTAAGGCGGDAVGLRALRFTTAGVAPRDQFAAYRAETSSVFEVEPTGRALEGYDAEQAVWRLGPLALRHIRGDGVRFLRTERQIRRDLLDHWGFSAYRRGSVAGECGGRPYATSAGSLFLYSLHQPFASERGAADLVGLFVPRDLLPECAAALDSRLGQDLRGGLAHLVFAHLDGLAAAADSLSAADGARAAEATLAVLRAAVTGLRDDVEAARPALEEALRARLLALIRRHIGSVRLDPGRLARLAGLSRTRLYEVFEPEGGVARAIQRERLRAVRRAMADPADRRPIARLAEDLGMPDPSVFSRAFRREFGETPRAFREQATLGMGVTRAAPARGAGADPRGLADLLRSLQAAA